MLNDETSFGTFFEILMNRLNAHYHKSVTDSKAVQSVLRQPVVRALANYLFIYESKTVFLKKY